MPKKFLLVILALLLGAAIMLMAASGERQKVTPISEVVTVQAPATRAACAMTKTTGVASSFWNGYTAGTGTYTLFDPGLDCGGSAYPFEITAFTFVLHDYAGQGQAVVDIVVYDIAASGSYCDGPGAELCRTTVTVNTFYPNSVTYNFPTPCCVNQQFFIGIEYVNAPAGVPSVVFDDHVMTSADTCLNWMTYIDGNHYEWFDFWSPPPAGYPIWWVDGETQSGNCQTICSWQPGDPYKMHFPQLPNEAGWDVNATQPMVLADDFRCEKTGPITDVHFWGGWKGDIEGQIVSFVISFHADIPAEQNPDGYSKPGPTLWEREVTDFQMTQHDPASLEGWYDPATGEILPNLQAHYWQYDICFDPNDPNLFVQDSGVIYWLNISAIVVDPQGTLWGWKSTDDHWNDDAVWAYWGNLNWIDIWEPAQPLVNNWYITVDPTGLLLGGGGSDPYGQGWYFYPDESWWNIWFYDHPFDPTRRKTGRIFFDAFPMDPAQPMLLEVAVNWSTDLWSIEFPDQGPPLPGVPETPYIGRTTLFLSEYAQGSYGPFEYVIPDYNPEWISVDVRGYNFEIPNGIVEHICQGSLDLSFVITGETVVEESGACCYDPTGLGVESACMYTTASNCAQLGGTFEGVGVPCQGDEACCLPNGGCIMADALCCVNELGGTPQGPGSQCSALEACCMPDGTCQMLDPVCCDDMGGTPQGLGSQCTALEACCLPGGVCRMLDPVCCDDQGGIPQGAGSTCGIPVACCFADGTCQTVDRVCCDDLGGTPSPFGARMCLGDHDGDGFDDACADRGDLKWRQMPDLDPTGIDVMNSNPGWFQTPVVLAEDYLCTQTGPITEIHIYGSWLEDNYPDFDPGAVTFTLSFHYDVPAGMDHPWSHPGEMVWMQTFQPGAFEFRPYAANLVEGFYDPFAQFWAEIGDFTCWEYIFYLTEEPFIQRGTEQEPIIYWLDAQAMPLGEAYFGWKTSLDHWNDDAVWAPGIEPIDPPLWTELRYPVGHPFMEQSIDLAFELYGEAQAPCDCRPGDANGDGDVANVGDAVYMINFVFKYGPAPTPYPICSGDANCDCQANVGDAVYIINYVFKSGPPPCDCPTWLLNCGLPLRK